MVVQLVNLLKIIELYTWSKWIIRYEKYASTKLFKQTNKQGLLNLQRPDLQRQEVQNSSSGSRRVMLSGSTSTSTCSPDPCIPLGGSATVSVYTVSQRPFCLQAGAPSSEGIISKLMPKSCIQQAAQHDFRLVASGRCNMGQKHWISGSCARDYTFIDISNYLGLVQCLAGFYSNDSKAT